MKKADTRRKWLSTLKCLRKRERARERENEWQNNKQPRKFRYAIIQLLLEKKREKQPTAILTSPNEITSIHLKKKGCSAWPRFCFSVCRGTAISAATLSTTMMMTRYVWQISKNLERNEQTKKIVRKNTTAYAHTNKTFVKRLKNDFRKQNDT